MAEIIIILYVRCIHMQENNKAKPELVKIITSENSPELAKKMDKLSKYFMSVNDKLYKDLANK